MGYYYQITENYKRVVTLQISTNTAINHTTGYSQLIIKTMEKKRKIRKIKAYTLKWEKEANNLARGYCPTIRPCRECGHPVISGYCCEFCGSVNP